MNDIVKIGIMVFSIIGCILILFFLKKINSIIFRYFEFTDESLSKQHLFKLSIGGPLLIAALLCIPLWFDKNINLSLTYSGYENFLSIFKLPIGVWSLSIPLVAIVAHIHRTIQTASQIEATKAKNLSDSFFSHHKFVTEALSKLPVYPLKINNTEFDSKLDAPYSLYNKFFPKSSYENGFSQEGFSDVVSVIQDTINSLSASLSMSKNSTDHEKELFHNFDHIIFSANKLKEEMLLSIYKTDNNNVYMYRSDTRTFKLAIPYENEDELKSEIRSIVELVTKVFELANVIIAIPAALHFYAYSNTDKNYKFKQLFSKMTRFDCRPGSSSSLNDAKPNDTLRFYDKYLEKFPPY